MKKIILALATLLFMGSAATKAQVTKVTVRSISGNSKEEVENIDNAKYRITYEGKAYSNEIARFPHQQNKENGFL